MFHGTNKKYAKNIQASGLDKESYVTNEFEFAAGYALRHSDPAILYFDNIQVQNPDESAYWGEVEFITTEKVYPSLKLVPVFNRSDLPEDYYDLDDDLGDRKYPQFFKRENWKEEE